MQLLVQKFFRNSKPLGFNSNRTLRSIFLSQPPETFLKKVFRPLLCPIYLGAKYYERYPHSFRDLDVQFFSGMSSIHNTSYARPKTIPNARHWINSVLGAPPLATIGRSWLRGGGVGNPPGPPHCVGGTRGGFGRFDEEQEHPPHPLPKQQLLLLFYKHFSEYIIRVFSMRQMQRAGRQMQTGPNLIHASLIYIKPYLF